ncbi:glutathione S-transferase [Paramagnetospirillum marisnigri]|uniref:Glutathione S-transferase n=1 Tax=Paramagnetospirillum marisnigri TaxID=1285242 RepID=A0A178MXZ8_9PROT|nr:glutathione S-transferase family protein [Paramagnetospirillum marisnigri]OAN54630.1 glutathione S-transferase [Paramagnetospirillum marisnigri]
MALTLVIGTKRWSTWSLRPWLALKVARIPFAEVEIALRQPETKAQILEWSPSGKVPLLDDDGFKVWDSLAICEYLADRFPEAGLWPEDAQARAVARCVSAEMHSGFMPLRRDCSMDVLADLPLAEINDEVKADIARIDAIWTDCRAHFGGRGEGGGGPFLFGRFSIADAMFAPVASRVRTYHLPVGAVSAAYVDAILGMAEVREWIAGAK